jgi:UDP-N-acetylglucosamine 2-epimerase
MHPRTANVIRDAGLVLPAGPGLRVISPLGYLDMIALVARSRIVLTDSGGLQKEAFFLGRPCVTLREETEWVETVSGGGNLLAGTDASRVRDAVAAWDATIARGEPDFASEVSRSFGDGRTSQRIIAAAMALLASHVPG